MLGFGNWIASFLHSIFAFVLILVPLVVFHEFGHYIFARIFGVRAEIFSVGFGPRLWSRQRGETEWRISAIPLGGYVKLLGEDREADIPEGDQARSLHRQAPWKRFLIFSGGPLFNFILSVFIFMVILVIGEPQMASVAGRIVRGSVAYQAGFQSGDRILSIQGQPVKRFEEVAVALNDNPGKVLDFEVLHPQSQVPLHLRVTPTRQSGYTLYGEPTEVGDIEGLLPVPRSNQVGVSNPSSPAGRAGIVTGDQVLALNQKPVSTWEELESIYERIPSGGALDLQIQKLGKRSSATGGSGAGAIGQASETLHWIKPGIKSEHSMKQSSLGDDFGLYSSELFVEKAMPQSPAEKAGVRAGDRLITVGRVEVQSFFDLKEAVQKSGEKDGIVQLEWERDGKRYSQAIQPTATSGRDPLLNHVTHYTVGVMPMLVLAEPVMVVERIWNPIKLVTLATERMLTFSWRNLVSLRKILTGDVSVGTLGGPIMIGKIAGESMTRGLIVFLTNMAIFSVGLGVLNILPVPVLDGGHLMLLGVEMIRRKPLTLRQMEVVQGIGLVLILALMGIAFKNDIARLIYS